MSAKLSVVIPIYGVEQYLEQCLDSVVNQTLHNIDIILVDDGSPDGCGEIADRYAARDQRIRVVHQKNGGLSAARNSGLDIVRTPYVVFVDSDDFVEPEYCRKLLELMTEEVDVGICGTNIICEDGYSHSVGKEYFTVPKPKAKQYAAVAWNKIYRMDFLLAHDIRFPLGLKHEDEYFWNAILPWEPRIATTPDKLYNYRNRSGGILGRVFAQGVGVRADMLKIAAALGEYYHEHGLMYGKTGEHYWEIFDTFIRGAQKFRRNTSGKSRRRANGKQCWFRAILKW